MPNDSNKDSNSEPEYKHIRYGMCTIHGMGVCPPECPAIPMNEIAYYDDPSFIELLKRG